jgi:SAM-dependent methyltransferase
MGKLIGETRIADGGSMNDILRESYNELAYPATPYPQTHPARLSAIATLFGMKPPSIQHARVLEIGCADGSNLLPIAASFPHSECIGIDLSERQVDVGHRLIDRLDLKNVELITGDFVKHADRLGSFDYVIAHGLYSWVPPAVAEELLAFCHRQLSPNGIAYISYNTLPGWSPRGALRELLLREDRLRGESDDPWENARRYLQTVRDASAKSPGAFPSLLVASLDVMLSHPASYWRHDLLEAEQHPVSFPEFAKRLAHNQLQYVADSEFHATLGRGIPSDVLMTLQSVARDRVELETLMDLMVFRSFRQSIVCRNQIAIDGSLDPERLREMYVTGLIEGIEDSGNRWSYRTIRGITLAENDLELRAAIPILIQHYPAPLSIVSLAQQVSEKIGKAIDIDKLCRWVLRLFSYDAVDLQTATLPICNHPTERPIGFLLARIQGESSLEVTNLRHDHVTLTESERAILLLLDGTRSVPELAREMKASFNSTQDIVQILNSLARRALLVG